MKRELTQKERLWQEATGHCIYCGRPVALEEMEIDHILPLSRGGANQFMNKACTCPGCNARKADSQVQDFLSDNLGPARLRRFVHRVKTLVEQGKMPLKKALSLIPENLETDRMSAPESHGRHFDSIGAENEQILWQIKRRKIQIISLTVRSLQPWRLAWKE